MSTLCDCVLFRYMYNIYTMTLAKLEVTPKVLTITSYLRTSSKQLPTAFNFKEEFHC